MNAQRYLWPAILVRIQVGALAALAIGVAAYESLVRGSDAGGWIILGGYAAVLLLRIVLTVERWTNPDRPDRRILLMMATSPILFGGLFGGSLVLLASSVALGAANVIGLVVQVVNRRDDPRFARRPPDEA